MYRHIPLIRLVATELSPKNQNSEVSTAAASTLRRPEKLNNSGVKPTEGAEMPDWFRGTEATSVTTTQRRVFCR